MRSTERAAACQRKMKVRLKRGRKTTDLQDDDTHKKPKSHVYVHGATCLCVLTKVPRK